LPPVPKRYWQRGRHRGGRRCGVLELCPGEKLCDSEAPEGVCEAGIKTRRAPGADGCRKNCRSLVAWLLGEPITIPKTDNPSQKEIDFYHSLYIQSLAKLFEKYKMKFGLSEVEMLEIN
ncbi:Diacylglycerol O-acyltransferase 2, partial [Ophiophagus hannah]